MVSLLFLISPYILVRGEEKLALIQHQVNSGHRIDSKPLMDQITVLDRESWDLHRKLLTLIHIRLRGAILNHNDGYQPGLFMQ